MEIKISDRLNAILGYAREEAMRTGSYAIRADHLMLGILRDSDNAACLALKELGVDTGEFKRYIDSRIFEERSVPYGELGRIGVARSAESAVNMAAMEALKAGQTEVSPAHLLLALSRIEGQSCRDFLLESGITPEILGNHLRKKGLLLNNARTVTPSAEEITHLIRINANPEFFS